VVGIGGPTLQFTASSFRIAGKGGWATVAVGNHGKHGFGPGAARQPDRFLYSNTGTAQCSIIITSQHSYNAQGAVLM
jgi:hypothetical protein